jgi:hypothetical protein
MSRKVMVDFVLKKNSKIRKILLFMRKDGEENDGNYASLKRKPDGTGQAELDAPGRYKILWYILGDAGGAIRLDVRAEGREIGAVTKEISAIAVGEKENAGRLIIELGGLT